MNEDDAINRDLVRSRDKQKHGKSEMQPMQRNLPNLWNDRHTMMSNSTLKVSNMQNLTCTSFSGQLVRAEESKTSLREAGLRLLLRAHSSSSAAKIIAATTTMPCCQSKMIADVKNKRLSH